MIDEIKDFLCMTPAMWFEGNRGFTIENCSRIEEYNDIFMQLAAGGLTIRIWGSGLRASDFATGGLAVSGRIISVEFEERGKGR
ncbi:MAG: YabP/YqfC family sporulation protein [Ruminococcus sp.]|nr:YabP/YqfC family sporulation protein [Ruminococcus sp.]MBQ3915890.1 YabP/YqfC family sporulation protein [Ruminococcus sp.]